MNDKQLQRLIQGSKRAQRVLQKRRQAEAEQQKYEARRQENLRLRAEYSEQLLALAHENGLWQAAEKAAQRLGGNLVTHVRFHVHQGMSTGCIDPSLLAPEIGELRPSFLALLISWQEGDDIKEVEIRMDRRQWINLQTRFFSIPPFIWRRNMPASLDALLDGAIRRPRIKPV